jgi:hypothetical protein
MAGADGDLWRTLVFLYSVVLVAAVCVPSMTVLPLFVGVDSLVALLCAGCLGLALTAGVVSLLVGRYDALVGRLERSTDTERSAGGPDAADTSMPDRTR